jgi:hypothetical protein
MLRYIGLFIFNFDSTNNLQKEKSRPGRVSLEAIQAMLFNCIGLFHSRNERDKSSALSSFSDLATLMNASQLLAPHQTRHDGVSQDADWICWVQDEVKRRTGYSIWVSMSEIIGCSFPDDTPAFGLYSCLLL